MVAELMVLTGKQERAAVLVAEDDVTDGVIAETVGIGANTLYRWKRDPAFRARVAQVRAEIATAVMSHGIARKENRIKAKNERWMAFRQIAEERKEKPVTDHMGDPIPGGSTGWIDKETTYTSGGIRVDFVPDERLNNILSKLENDAARETGQLEDASDMPVEVHFTINIDRTDRAAAI